MFAGSLPTFTIVAGLLGALLTLAAWHDVRSLRIPNAIVASGIVAALLLHAGLPAGIGPLSALGGLLVGFGVFLPLYLLRAAGAGDVKLMAMTGAFVGPLDALGAALFSGIAGAVLAAGVALRRGATRRMANNIRDIAYSAGLRLAGVRGVAFDPQRDTATKVPYSLAIAAGTATWLCLRQI